MASGVIRLAAQGPREDGRTSRADLLNINSGFNARRGRSVDIQYRCTISPAIKAGRNLQDRLSATSLHARQLLVSDNPWVPSHPGRRRGIGRMAQPLRVIVIGAGKSWLIHNKALLQCSNMIDSRPLWPGSCPRPEEGKCPRATSVLDRP